MITTRNCRCCILGVEYEDMGNEFERDVNSRLRFTYRKGFVPIKRAIDGPSPMNLGYLARDFDWSKIGSFLFRNSESYNEFTSDVGWGCMIRTGQSLLGNAILLSKLGRDFRKQESLELCEAELEVVDWFMDEPDRPFSIHQFVEKGAQLCGTKPGEWFGPAATAQSIQKLIGAFPQCGIDHCLVSVSSGDVYDDEILQLLNTNESSTLLLLLGVKLGVEKVNEYYWKDIQQLLKSKFSVGISGGRPSSSLYFFGYQGSSILYFDPHYPQLSEKDVFHTTIHSKLYGKLPLSELDPSMLIGILIQGKAQYEEWKQQMSTSTIVNLLNKKNIFDSAVAVENEILDPPDDDYVDLGAMINFGLSTTTTGVIE